MKALGKGVLPYMFTVMAGTAIADTADSEAGKLYASKATTQIYGEMFKLIAPHVPNLNVMIITEDDIDPKGRHKKYDTNPSLGPQITDWIFSLGCTPTEINDTEIDKALIIGEGKNRLFSIISSSATANNPFIATEQFHDTLHIKFSEFNDALEGVILASFAGTESSTSLSADFPSISTNTAIITMPAQYKSQVQYAQELSGLDPVFLTNLEGTPQELSFSTLAHEIGGHAYHKHSGASHPDANYACTRISLGLVHDSIHDESIADSEGAEIYKSSLPISKIINNPHVPKQDAQLRAIGNIFLSPNLYSAQNSTEINGHVTTIGFDPSEKNSRSDFNLEAMENIGALAPIINTYADTLTGFLKRLQIGMMPQMYQEILTLEDIQFVQQLPNTPSFLAQEMISFSWLGSDARLNQADPISQKLHHAAILYLDKSGAFTTLKQILKPEYGKALDNLLHDYKKAVKAIAPNLTDTELATGFEEQFNGKINFEAMGIAILSNQQVISIDTGEALPTVEIPASMTKKL